MNRSQGSPVEPPFGCSGTTLRWLCFKCERVAGECQCDGPTYRFQKVPVTACSGPRLVGETVLAIVRDLGVPEEPDRRPRYFAEGVFVIVTATRRRMSLAIALEEAQRLLLRSIEPNIGTLAEAYQNELSDLIEAMREAMGNCPPPAQAMRSAA